MKKYLLFAFSLCLLSACGSDEGISPENTEQVPIMLSAKSLSIGVETKAPYILTTPNADTTLVARVISSQATGNYSTLYSDGSMTFVSAAKVGYTGTPTGTNYYPANDALLYFSGLHPSADWTLSGTNQASRTFNGSIDVMYAKEVSAKKTTSPAALAFDHLLTLLHVSVKAADAAAITAWGNITKIELTQAGENAVKGKVEVTMGTTLSSSFSVVSEVTVIPFYTASESDEVIAYGSTEFTSQTLTTSEALAAYSMVEAITADGTKDYTLKIYSANNTAGTSVDIGLKGTGGSNFTSTTQGKSFDIALTFSTTAIEATATVAAWTPSGGAEIIVQ